MLNIDELHSFEIIRGSEAKHIELTSDHQNRDAGALERLVKRGSEGGIPVESGGEEVLVLPFQHFLGVIFERNHVGRLLGEVRIESKKLEESLPIIVIEMSSLSKECAKLWIPGVVLRRITLGLIVNHL